MGRVTFDFSDIEAFIHEGMEEVKAVERAVGEEAVQYAVRNGDYKNRTGVLRTSNKFLVDDKGLELKNEAEYASFVESKGFEVLSSAALEAEKLLKERIA